MLGDWIVLKAVLGADEVENTAEEGREIRRIL